MPVIRTSPTPPRHGEPARRDRGPAADDRRPARCSPAATPARTRARRELVDLDDLVLEEPRGSRRPGGDRHVGGVSAAQVRGRARRAAPRRAQPARQRHPPRRRRRSRSSWPRPTAGRRSPSPTTARASRRTVDAEVFERFTRLDERARRAPAAPVWASPSPTTSSRATTAPSPSTTARREAPASSSICRQLDRTPPTIAAMDRGFGRYRGHQPRGSGDAPDQRRP